MKFEVVSMQDVPEPSMRHSSRKYADLYAALLKLQVGQALKLAVAGRNELRTTRQSAQRAMQQQKRRLLSSRNEANTELYLWLQTDTPVTQTAHMQHRNARGEE